MVRFNARSWLSMNFKCLIRFLIENDGINFDEVFEKVTSVYEHTKSRVRSFKSNSTLHLAKLNGIDWMGAWMVSNCRIEFDTLLRKLKNGNQNGYLIAAKKITVKLDTNDSVGTDIYLNSFNIRGILHAEYKLINEKFDKPDPRNLNILLTTLEPCALCCGSVLTYCDVVVYLTPDPRYCGHLRSSSHFSTGVCVFGAEQIKGYLRNADGTLPKHYDELINGPKRTFAATTFVENTIQAANI